MRIAFITSEAVPFAKTGGLADVSGALTKELARRGHEVVMFMPKYAAVADKLSSARAVVEELAIPVAGHHESLTLWKLEQDGVINYFVDHKSFFDRPELYRDPETGEDWADNDERFIFFARSVIESCRALQWIPNVVHANDWQSALVPTYLNTFYADDPVWANTRSLFTVHNIAYQGMFKKPTFAKLGVAERWWYPESPFEYWDQVNFLKLGLMFSESLSTVSQRYAEEIRESSEFGYGMEGILEGRRDDLSGIVNGIDYDVWNPLTDEHIPEHFSPKNLAGKLACKKALLKEMGLPVGNGSVPLIGIISRLADQKGFDLIAEEAEALMERDLQMVVLGTGDAKYHELFEALAKKYPNKFAVSLKFDNGLAHRIEAGSDMFLMPSRYEPCGLNQLYSLKYGTIPVVRTTGGLADTIEPYADGEGTGFRFEEYTGEALIDAVDRALAVYADRKAWKALTERAMVADFSWEHSASQYEELYRATIAKPKRTNNSVEVG